MSEEGEKKKVKVRLHTSDKISLHNIMKIFSFMQTDIGPYDDDPKVNLKNLNFIYGKILKTTFFPITSLSIEHKALTYDVTNKIPCKIKKLVIYTEEIANPELTAFELRNVLLTEFGRINIQTCVHRRTLWTLSSLESLEIDIPSDGAQFLIGDDRMINELNFDDKTYSFVDFPIGKDTFID